MCLEGFRAGRGSNNYKLVMRRVAPGHEWQPGAAARPATATARFWRPKLCAISPQRCAQKKCPAELFPGPGRLSACPEVRFKFDIKCLRRSRILRSAAADQK